MTRTLLCAFAVACFASVGAFAPAAAADEALELAERVFNRTANEGRVGVMSFRLTNGSGSVRERRALMAHSQVDDFVRVAIFFTAPASIRDTAFLTYSASDRSEENWLFLPATERVRRLPASERGDYFMGTDLTYGDIRDDFKFRLDDWDFSIGGDDPRGTQLLGRVKSDQIAREIGYSAFDAIIDNNTLFPIQIEFADREGAPLKRVEILQQEEVGGAWTAMKFSVENIQRNHRTDVSFENMRYVPGLRDEVFNPTSLALGVPAID